MAKLFSVIFGFASGIFLLASSGEAVTSRLPSPAWLSSAPQSVLKAFNGLIGDKSKSQDDVTAAISALLAQNPSVAKTFNAAKESQDKRKNALEQLRAVFSNHSLSVSEIEEESSALFKQFPVEVQSYVAAITQCEKGANGDNGASLLPKSSQL
ncbi:hypothetical protein Ddc_13896 [Ditylenchus destructor]|nr:hypothetical protein Ddc_13896 [Ditylenchus destructor]